MDLGELYSYINFITNKEQLGDPATPEKYDILLKYFSINSFKDLLSEFLQAISEPGNTIGSILTDNHPLKRFEKSKKIQYSSPSPIVTKPDDYSNYITLACYSKGLFRNVEILNSVKFSERKSNILSKPIDEYPIGLELATGIEVIPNNLSKFNLFYFRLPEIPVFDYCIDQNDNTVYMPPESVLKQINGNVDLYDVNGNVLQDDVSYPKTVQFPYTSQSNELDWGKGHQRIVIDKIIASVLERSREVPANIKPTK